MIYISLPLQMFKNLLQKQNVVNGEGSVEFNIHEYRPKETLEFTLDLIL